MELFYDNPMESVSGIFQKSARPLLSGWHEAGYLQLVGWAAAAARTLTMPLVGDIYQVECFLVPKRVMNFQCGLC